MPVNLGSRCREPRSGQDKGRRRPGKDKDRNKGKDIGSSTRSLSPHSLYDSDPEMRARRWRSFIYKEQRKGIGISELSLSDLEGKRSAYEDFDFDSDSQAEAKGKRNPADVDSVSDSQAEAKGKRNLVDGDSDSDSQEESWEAACARGFANKQPCDEITREWVGPDGAVYHIPADDEDIDLKNINSAGGGTGIPCDVCGGLDHWRLACTYFRCFPPDGKLLNTDAYEIVCERGHNESAGDVCVSGWCPRVVRRKTPTYLLEYLAMWVPPKKPIHSSLRWVPPEKPIDSSMTTVMAKEVST